MYCLAAGGVKWSCGLLAIWAKACHSDKCVSAVPGVNYAIVREVAEMLPLIPPLAV